MANVTGVEVKYVTSGRTLWEWVCRHWIFSHHLGSQNVPAWVLKWRQQQSRVSVNPRWPCNMSKRWTRNKPLLFQATGIWDLCVNEAEPSLYGLTHRVYQSVFWNSEENVPLSSFPAQLLFFVIFFRLLTLHLSVRSVFVNTAYLGLATWIYFKWLAASSLLSWISVLS